MVQYKQQRLHRSWYAAGIAQGQGTVSNSLCSLLCLPAPFKRLVCDLESQVYGCEVFWICLVKLEVIIVRDRLQYPSFGCCSGRWQQSPSVLPAGESQSARSKRSSTSSEPPQGCYALFEEQNLFFFTTCFLVLRWQDTGCELEGCPVDRRRQPLSALLAEIGKSIRSK